MSVPREGGCACGAVRYRLTSDPLFVHCCHCLNCQRQTGSAFVINLLIEADRLELVAGEPQPVDVPRDDGSMQRIFRCPTCQVAVFSQYTRPEVRFVRAGTLDEPTSVVPDVHIFTKSKVGWVTLPGLGAGVRRVLRHEGPLAGRQPRTGRGDDGGTLRRLSRRLSAGRSDASSSGGSRPPRPRSGRALRSSSRLRCARTGGGSGPRALRRASRRHSGARRRGR